MVRLDGVPCTIVGVMPSKLQFHCTTDVWTTIAPALGASGAPASPGPWLTVIGIVPEIRTVKLDESRATPPTAYVPHRLMSTCNYGIVTESVRIDVFGAS